MAAPNPFAPTGPASTAFSKLGTAIPQPTTMMADSPAGKFSQWLNSQNPYTSSPKSGVNLGRVTGPMAVFAAGIKNAHLGKGHTTAAITRAQATNPATLTHVVAAAAKASMNHRDASSAFGHPSQSVPNNTSTPHSTLIADAKAATDPARNLTGTNTATPTTSSDPYSGYAASGANIGKMLDPNLANLIASGTWDPVIKDYQNQMSLLPGQTNQNKADITNWMNQVLSSLATGTSRADAAYDTGASTAKDTAAGILSSLGGADSGAGGSLGQAGANASAMMQALKGNSDSFNADMQPIINLEKEGQLKNQDANQSFNMKTLASQLAGAQSSKAGAAAQSGMDINTANNALAQQRWANAFGVQQQSDANNVAAGNSAIANAYKTAATAKILNGLQNPAPAKGSFDATPPATRTKLATNIISGIQGYLQKNPKAPASVLDGMVKHAVQTSGWNISDPKVVNWINSIYSNLNINPQTQGFNTPTG